MYPENFMADFHYQPAFDIAHETPSIHPPIKAHFVHLAAPSLNPGGIAVRWRYSFATAMSRVANEIELG